LHTHDEQLGDVIRSTLASADGIDFLIQQLQPEQEEDRRRDVERAIGVAFSRDADMAESVARTLHWVDPAHWLVPLLGREIRRPPTTDQRIRVLARYALDRILPDKARAEEWQWIRSEEHTSELQSRFDLVCRLLLEKKKFAY